MKNILPIIILSLLSFKILAHDQGHGTPLKSWKLQSSEESFKAEFIKCDQKKVWLSSPLHQIIEFHISDFSPEDQKYILHKHQIIQSLNSEETFFASFFYSKEIFILLGSGLLLLSAYLFVKRKKRVHMVYGMLGVAIILFVSCSNDNPSIENDPEESTDVPPNDLTFMQSLFDNFSNVSTFSDETYFYVSSNGLPEHNMMVGITNWQQQVPININYTGSNSWAIPIQPQLAENPLSTQTNLLKGAIAIASNGIPIFNPLNNRGEDANSIGELDQWGGHCGRADDYHYHLPPTHLQNIVGEGMPIAYAVDGFPVYGETSEQLDQYLGKFNSDSSYQYHTIPEYPYFIAGMRGEVTLDPNTSAPENQVVPQATTQELRPALSPLNGAVITAFESIYTNSYSLTYTLNSENYLVNYSWDDNGLYTYEFVKPDGTITTETYQR